VATGKQAREDAKTRRRGGETEARDVVFASWREFEAFRQPGNRHRVDVARLVQVRWHTMRRTTVKLPDDLAAKWRHDAARRGSTIADVRRETIKVHVGGSARRSFIAAKAGRSGLRDTARHIEEIIRQEARRSG
jgi:hypothetical protein